MRKLCLCLLLAGIALNASADEVIDSINEGLSAYKDGRYSEATGALDYASALIREKKGAAIGVVFPAALPGWEKGEVETAAAGAAMFGGGVSATCEYRNRAENGQVSMNIMSDSPMIQALTMALANPMLARADGGKMIRFGGNKGQIKYQADARDGEINVVADNLVLVQVTGRNLDEETLRAYAEAIDWDKLEGIAEAN